MPGLNNDNEVLDPDAVERFCSTGLKTPSRGSRVFRLKGPYRSPRVPMRSTLRRDSR